MLEVSKLRRCYGDFLAVDAVSFSIRSGEIVGLLGHNGAGKTTIMKMLSGFLEPDQGTVTVDGLNLARQPKQVQAKLGYLPENLPVYPEMAVADYLDFAAVLKGLQGDIRKAEIKRVIQATDLGNKVLAPISTLSRGYRQRVGVAQAILGKPRLLILDEPTNGLDPTQTEHMRELIRGLSQQATVILSTHIMQEVDALCDRVLILNNGRLVIDEELARLKQSSQLQLVTDVDADELKRILQAVNAVADLQPAMQPGGNEPTAPWQSYVLQLQAAVDIQDAAAQTAAAIVAANGRVATLQPLVRNLEMLFSEVSAGAQAAPGQEVDRDAA